MTNRIPTREEYEARERADLYRQLSELETLPLSERRENREEWREAMANHLSTVTERIGWLFNGSYGWGAQDRAREIINAKRGNRVAAITQLLAGVEWSCSQGEAIKAWRSLSDTEKRALESAVSEAIEYYREFLE